MMAALNKKQKFLQQVESVLKTAKPNIRRVDFFTITDEEHVAITMNDGYVYTVNVTGNSLIGILADVVEKMKYK